MPDRPAPRRKRGLRFSDGQTRNQRRLRHSPPGSYWMHGRHAVRAALANPNRRVLRLLLADSARKRLAAELPSSLPVETLSNADLDRRLGADSRHGGIAAEVVPLAGGRSGLAALLDRPETCLLLLLDQVADPRNVGAILRSACAFGADAVVTPEARSPSESGALAAAASGALDLVPYLRVGNLAALLRKLADLDWHLAGLDDRAPGSVDELARRRPSARLGLVLGAEGVGLRRLTLESCHRLLSISTNPEMPSLNVAAAAAVALHAASRPLADLRKNRAGRDPPA